MNRDIKNNGVYVECDADQIIDNIEALKKADIVVITKSRMELAGLDKKLYIERFTNEMSSNEKSDNFKRLNNQQKSDFIIRKMLVTSWVA